MGIRKEMRVSQQLLVRIWGIDAGGELFEQNGFTVDITSTGAQIWGLYRKLNRGSILTVQHGLSQARFSIVWVGLPGTATEGRVGLQLVERGKYIWGEPLPGMTIDSYEGPRTPVTAAEQPWD
jgi:hypothetical protein